MSDSAEDKSLNSPLPPPGTTLLECDQCGLKQSEWKLPLVVGASCPRHYLDDDSCDGTICIIPPPPETTVETLIARWRELAEQQMGWSRESDRKGDGANSHTERARARIYRECALELAALQSSPSGPALE